MANITHVWALTKPEKVLDRYFNYLASKGVYANLLGANLLGANLRDADLDFSSSVPMWCGGIKIDICAKIAKQLIYHAFAQNCEDPEYNRLKGLVADFANEFHRVKSGECEKIK